MAKLPSRQNKRLRPVVHLTAAQKARFAHLRELEMAETDRNIEIIRSMEDTGPMLDEGHAFHVALFRADQELREKGYI